uniref:Hyaluronidase n=1 Tax=Monopterus albus TaxID=43700 RepID=A0A3Q3Q2X4_MONAL
MAAFHPELLLLVNVITLVSGLQVKTSHFSQVPFLTVWNAPTANCFSQYGVDLDLGIFNIVHNQNQSFMGDNITIFYSDRFGLYPRYSGQDQAINGGVPQNASLEKHLRVVYKNISTAIPDRNFPGLAVVDWENWRPLWARNWDSMQVYREASKALVRLDHPDWSPAKVEAEARVQFEDAARKFMEETLKLGKQERPNGLWGYYGFPNCYNYYSDKITNYTGECPAIEIKRNNQLLWLWKVSSALYPDIYLSLNLRNLSQEVLFYTHHRILEAMRVGDRVTPSGLPVFTYARIVYTYTLEFLSQEHLVYTIGESVALGSTGVVLVHHFVYISFRRQQVGAHLMTLRNLNCRAYLHLDPAVWKVVSEKMSNGRMTYSVLGQMKRHQETFKRFDFECNQIMCSSKGRCQRRNLNSRAYLHLDPAVWKVVSEKMPNGRTTYSVLGQMKRHQETFKRFDFECKCYPGWSGKSCSIPNPE